MSRGRPKCRLNAKSETGVPFLASDDVPHRKNLTGMLAAFVCGIALTALIGTILSPTPVVGSRNKPPKSANVESAVSPAKAETDPQLWRAVSMTDEELSAVSVAYLNLLCASGLPGSESIDIAACRKKLDSWAETVKFHTESNFYKFKRNPGEFEGKEGYYRMLMLVTVLQQDLGVHYNMDRVRQVDFTRSQDLFIHGMIEGKQEGGTCVSMPVLYTAIARRLGYPVRLVLAKAHVFCRWEDGRERFNIEGAGVGMSSPPNEHYCQWPHPISDEEVQRGLYLRSLTPREELAAFMAARGHCLQDNGRRADAFVAYAHAYELDPKLPDNLGFLYDAVRKQADPTALAREQELKRRLRDADTFADVEYHNQLVQGRQEREFQQVMDLNRRNEADQQRLWNPLAPRIPNVFPNASLPFPNHGPSPFPHD